MQASVVPNAKEIRCEHFLNHFVLIILFFVGCDFSAEVSNQLSRLLKI